MAQDLNSIAPSATPPPAWARLVALRDTNPTNDQLKELVHEQIAQDLADTPIAAKYSVMFLYDAVAIARSDTDQLYRALNTLKGAFRKKPLLLILDSDGGDVGAAYFIAKICREFTDAAFEVAVPRRAKSAATLICCGAERIHMGSLSELGPIDPQFEGVPALALKNSIEHLAELTKRSRL
jgi:ClpP class serine protease